MGRGVRGSPPTFPTHLQLTFMSLEHKDEAQHRVVLSSTEEEEEGKEEKGSSSGGAIIMRVPLSRALAARHPAMLKFMHLCISWPWPMSIC